MDCRQATTIAAAALFAVLALSCTKRAPKPPCLDDLECYAERVRTCEPATVTVSGPIDVDGIPVKARVRSTVIEARGSWCHITLEWLEGEQPSTAVAAGRLARKMQCLYPPEEGAAVVRKIAGGQAKLADLEPCYPDGECGPIPLLSVGCVLEKCVLGRWTYTCELGGEDGRAKDVVQCRGTRLSDHSPPDAGCASYCEGGPELLDCRANPRKVPRWLRE